jgi:hypothetical protein
LYTLPIYMIISFFILCVLKPFTDYLYIFPCYPHFSSPCPSSPCPLLPADARNQ